MSLQVRRLATSAELRSISGVWSELAEQAIHPTPFMSQDWFECCRIAADDESVELLLVSDSVAPVALVPLRHRTSTRRGLRAKYLSLLDCPDSPFADIIPSGAGEPVAGAVLAHLATRSDWDILELGRLPSDSPTLKAFEGECEGRLHQRRAGAEMSPYMAIEGTWQAFYASRSQRFKKTIRNIQNRLARLGTVAFEEHRSLDPAGPVFEEMIDLTRRSWKAEEGVAIATMPRMREFFAELSRRATERGWLSLWLLRLEGRAIAMEYQLRDKGVVYALRADFDLEYAASSPGSALNFEIARSLFERGEVREYQMGPGLNEYKMRWASGSHETVRLHAYRDGLYPTLLHFGETVLAPALRRVRDRLR